MSKPTSGDTFDPWSDGGGVAGTEIKSRGPAIDALERPAPEKKSSDPFDTYLRIAAELLALGDFSGALENAEKALALRPSHGKALELRETSQQTLLKMFEAKLDGLWKVPKVKVSSADLMWLNLDHRAGFILSQIDGTVTYEDIISLSGMGKFETCRILAHLVDEGVIA